MYATNGLGDAAYRNQIETSVCSVCKQHLGSDFIRAISGAISDGIRIRYLHPQCAESNGDAIINPPMLK